MSSNQLVAVRSQSGVPGGRTPAGQPGGATVESAETAAGCGIGSGRGWNMAPCSHRCSNDTRADTLLQGGEQTGDRRDQPVGLEAVRISEQQPAEVLEDRQDRVRGDL